MSIANPRAVTLVATLSEISADEALKGSRAWVARIIEEGRLSVSTSQQGHPCVWLSHPEIKGGKATAVAIFAPDFNLVPRLDYFPFEDSLMNGDDCEFAGVTLTRPGRQLLSAFAKKCQTLLKFRLRRADRAQPGRLRVKLLPAE